MIDWRFLLSKYVVGRKRAFGYWWDWDTELSDSEDFNEPVILKRGADFLDAGACFGFWSVRASAYYERVFAIEPFPANYEILLKNLKINKCDNVIPVRVAVAADIGESDLFGYGRFAWGEPSLLKEHMGHSSISSLRVPITTIDSLVERYEIKPSLIKLDVEGAENDALTGAAMCLGTYRPELLIEVHTPVDPRGFVKENYDWKARYRYLNAAHWKDERQLHLYGRPV